MFCCLYVELHFRQFELLERGLLNEALSLSEEYNAFAAAAAGKISTDISMEEEAVKFLDGLCEKYESKPVNQRHNTKNLVYFKQELSKAFIKGHLLGQCAKSKECPHCKAPLRAIRSEYNSRIYLKPDRKSVV